MADERKIWMEFEIDKPKGAVRANRIITLTRAEAIERMAKTLAFAQAKTFVNKNQWELVMMGCKFEAEAALNALLVGDK